MTKSQFGNVGSIAAQSLADMGARAVAVSDVHGGIFQLFFWKEDEVNSRLRDILTAALDRTLARAEEQGVDLRTAALMEAVSRVARATSLRGLYP